MQIAPLAVVELPQLPQEAVPLGRVELRVLVEQLGHVRTLSSLCFHCFH